MNCSEYDVQYHLLSYFVYTNIRIVLVNCQLTIYDVNGHRRFVNAIAPWNPKCIDIFNIGEITMSALFLFFVLNSFNIAFSIA